MDASQSLYLPKSIPYSTNRKNPAKIILICLVLATIIYGAHAVEKHAQAAEKVRQAMVEQGAVETWEKPDGRLVNICKVEDQFGLMITAGNHEVTCFIKEKMTRLEQVRKYLENMGAKLRWVKP